MFCTSLAHLADVGRRNIGEFCEWFIDITISRHLYNIKDTYFMSLFM